MTTATHIGVRGRDDGYSLELLTGPRDPDIDPRDLTQDQESEVAILGILSSWGRQEKRLSQQDAALVFDLLSAEDFRFEAPRRLFAAARQVWEALGTVDPVAIQSYIRQQEGIAAWLDGSAVVRLMQDLADYSYSPRVREHCERLRACTARRNALAVLEQARIALTTPGDGRDVDAVLTRAQSDLGLLGNVKTQPLRNIGPMVRETLVPQVTNPQVDRTQAVCRTGWGTFDRDFLPGGFRRGRLTVLGAKRKTGKSTLLAAMTRAAAASGSICGVVTAEMSQEECVLRMICAEGNLQSSRVEIGELDKDERQRFEVAAKTVGDLPIYVNDRRGQDVHQVLNWARFVKAHKGLDFLAVDYLQLLADHLRRETRERNVSDAARRLLWAAQELDCHVLLLSQLNTEGQAKWSGQSMDDAHFNWRVARCDEKGKADDEGEYWRFHVEQRFGRSGTVGRLYQPDLSTGRVYETNTSPLPARQEASNNGREY